MSGVFQNIDLHPPHRLVSVCPPAFDAGGGHTRWVERGVEGGVNILEDARHGSVLYICRYFVVYSIGLWDLMPDLNTENVLLNVYGAPELIPRNEFRHPM
jgi:hypothetical protein